MANLLQSAGAQPQKHTRFAPIYTGRFFSGLWTNRSPLRDAATTHFTEKYYGGNGDALIAGQNVEITNRLTLARRAGNTSYDLNSFSGVDHFDSFRLSSPSSEKIHVMVDQIDGLYSLLSGVKTLVWPKGATAGQSYLQSVGNSLYFGNGIDNKKWLQSMHEWTESAQWGGPTTPYMSTFFIDSNGNIQQLVGTSFSILDYTITSNVVTFTWDRENDNVSVAFNLSDVVSIGDNIKLNGFSTSTFFNDKIVEITAVTNDTFTAIFEHVDTTITTELGYADVLKGGKPYSSQVEPDWNTTVLTPQVTDLETVKTYEGMVVWINRGIPTFNWGINPPEIAPNPIVGSSRIAWTKNTFYSYAGVIIDSNGNLQQVITAGKSGTSEPVWKTNVDDATSDGTVVWKMIQTAASLVWQSHTHYEPGDFLVGNAGGTNCLFQLAEYTCPTLVGNVDAYIYSEPSSNAPGAFDKYYPLTLGSANGHAVGNSLRMNEGSTASKPFNWIQVNEANEVTGSFVPFPTSGLWQNFALVILATLHIPVAGQYTFTSAQHDGILVGIGGGAEKVSGTGTDMMGHDVTAVNAYPIMGGTNGYGLQDFQYNHDSYTVNFPQAGDYPVEIDFKYWYHKTMLMAFGASTNALFAGTPMSGSTQPIWPVWTTTYAPNYASVRECGGVMQWNNLGPVTDYVWKANINFTLPNQTIIDPAGNTQAPYRTGVTGTTAPTFSTGLNQLTIDNPDLIWILTGTSAAPDPGTVSTYNGGWQYGIALVNTLDNTVSNCGPLTPATGNFIGVEGVSFAAGSGLPDPSLIDSQVDYVAIFRTTDGQSIPFLIDGKDNTMYTVPLAEYLANGYIDKTPDTELNNLISAAISGENTPPGAGAVNLTFHLNRIFFSIGNVVYWTTGAATPVGNGINGVAPLNFSEFPSTVKRIVPTSIGALVFTVSDIYQLRGDGVTSGIRAYPYAKGIGLLSYNALDVNGTIIGFFTSDKQFVILDPSAGISYVGFPIGDKLRKSTDAPGTYWNANNVYVTWHVDGEDQAWYVADGKYGWYRLMTTPAPETGLTWSPFAAIQGGCKAVQSIEVSPGVHKLLLGPIGSGQVLFRDLENFSDNGVAYSAWAVIGSLVLAQPGQVAEIQFITTDSVRLGTPLELGILLDEALPYYTEPFDVLKHWTDDPYSLPRSKSLLSQRFYLSEEDETALCRHMQLKINFGTEAVQNELLTLTVFGGYAQES